MNQTYIVGPREGESNLPKVAALALASALALAALALASVGPPGPGRNKKLVRASHRGAGA